MYIVETCRSGIRTERRVRLHETYSPTAKWTTLRILSIANHLIYTKWA